MDSQKTVSGGNRFSKLEKGNRLRWGQLTSAHGKCQPVKPDETSIEIEEIRFQTFMAEPVLVMPAAESDSTPAEFGLQITNLSSHPYHFTFFGLIPEIKGLNGQRLKAEYGRNVTRWGSYALLVRAIAAVAS